MIRPPDQVGSIIILFFAQLKMDDNKSEQSQLQRLLTPKQIHSWTNSKEAEIFNGRAMVGSLYRGFVRGRLNRSGHRPTNWVWSPCRWLRRLSNTKFLVSVCRISVRQLAIRRSA